MTETRLHFSAWQPRTGLATPDTRVRLGRSVLQAFTILYFMSSMAAYNFGPIPIVWMGQAGFIAGAVGLMLYVNKIRLVPGAGLLMLFIGWAFFLNTMNAGEFSAVMPPKATLPYSLYIVIRYVNIFSFVSAFYITYWLAKSGYEREVVRAIIVVALIACAAAAYIYLAQIIGLPELPRTRLGTSGGEQPTAFSSGNFYYRRAIGTFREPSHLAEWLLLPFFISFLRRDRLGTIARFATGGILLLTVSLTAIFSITMGTALAMLITNPFNKKYARLIIAGALLTGIVFLGLQRVVVGSGLQGATLAAVVTGRIGTTIGGGFGKTDRAFVYELMSEHPLPVLGYGLGNSNIYASVLTQNDAVMSFLSLYVNTIYATGVFGFIVLVIFLLRPLVQYLASRPRRQGVHLPILVMAYCSYLVAFGVNAEELSTPFALIAGLFTYQAAQLAMRHRIIAAAMKQHSKPFLRWPVPKPETSYRPQSGPIRSE